MRIIVDANNWISSLLNPEFQTRLEIVFEPEHHLIVSEGLFEDLTSAMSKPYLAKRIPQAEYEGLVALLRIDAELVDVHSVIEVCRDPKDNFLLALAKDGNADYLITGDGDLLALKEFGKTKIVKLTEFEAKRQ
jgi:putative PIN family toxin of toxin-antitoxin system